MNKRLKITPFLKFFSALLLVSCATYKPQLKEGTASKPVSSRTPTHTFFIAGGAGNTNLEDLNNQTMSLLKNTLDNAPEASTMLFTGDYVSKKKNNWAQDTLLINRQLELVENFKGKTYFVPGINEWKSKDAKRIEKVEDYLKDKGLEGKTEVQPNNVCPIEYYEIDDNLDMILIDSDWLLNGWNGVDYINQKCGNMDTPRRFSEELAGYITDAQDKNLVIAMHHPIFGNGEYDGKITFKDALLPIPGVSTLLEGIGIVAAFSPKMLHSRPYGYYRVLVAALAQNSDRITFVSGHEENLQLLMGKNKTPQIVSGSLGTTQATRRSGGSITGVGGTLPFEGLYTYGERGFAKLEFYEDGSSEVTFITPEDEEEDVRLDVLPEFPEGFDGVKDTLVGVKTVKVGMFEDSTSFQRSGFYKFLWGDRYRDYYAKPVTANVVKLDTLYGGLKIIKRGGGQQSSSLRMVDSLDRQFNMRSLRKNPIQALSAQLPGISFEAEKYENTVADDLFSDFFTTSSQYMQLPIYDLATAAHVNHSKPRLFYVPKQKTLGKYNETYGNQLYFIEERPSDEQNDFIGYNMSNPEVEGTVDDFESTTDMLELIHEDEKNTVDQQTFIRTRLFNMLLGDWDRHQDQFRWIEYEISDDEVRLIPVPRDRDNAFPKFGGVALPVLQWFTPLIRSWESYGPEINSVKWFNARGYSLDRALLTKYGTDEWIKQAQQIQNDITEADIEEAFAKLPEELQDSTFQYIKSSFRQRLKDLPKYAEEYGSYLNKNIVLHGTEKDDIFEIERLEEGKTRVTIKRDISDEKNPVIYDRTFNSEDTGEIWIYGLNDDDQFNVFGDGDTDIFVRLAGGYGTDHYNVTNKGGLKVYDLPYEESVYEAKNPRKQLTNLYTTNNYNWRYLEPNANKVIPTAGYRLDDGVFVGAKDVYTVNGFNGNPFRQQHSLTAKYYFTFNAVELNYLGEYANIFPRWNLETEAYYTSGQFATNFFGYGNESVNREDALGRNYFRARMEQLRVRAGLTFISLKVNALFENYKVNENPNRLFTADNLDPRVFEGQSYLGAETTVYYNIDDSDGFPTQAFYIGLTAGYKFNTDVSENNFGYVSGNVEFAQKLIESGDLVLASTLEAKTNFGDEYFFYHAPTLGGQNGLRGFRDQRFTGDSYFFQSSDLRLRISEYKTGVLPVTVGIFGGFDYGRVWEKGGNSEQWHTSQGGGIWISGLSQFGVSFGYFNSVETNIVQVGLGFGF